MDDSKSPAIAPGNPGGPSTMSQFQALRRWPIEGGSDLFLFTVDLFREIEANAFR